MNMIKNGCRVYSSDGYELKFEPPAIKDMSQYKDDNKCASRNISERGLKL